MDKLGIRLDPVWTSVFVILGLCWVVFWLAIFFRAAAASSTVVHKRDLASIAGFWVQGLAFAIVGGWWRQPFTPLTSFGMPLELLLALVTIALAVASVWLVVSAVRTLGQHWSLTARVVEGHKLVTAGPYRLVRNPIYTGMFGLLVASGLAIGQWFSLLIGVSVFLFGTMIRVRSEEKLLQEAFGAEYEAYAHRVRAIIPFVL